MLATVDVGLNHYYKTHGKRCCNSPMFHYPDYCPYFTGDAVGDCPSKCNDKRTIDRPCVKAVENTSGS